jgi:hypothetical protein
MDFVKWIALNGLRLSDVTIVRQMDAGDGSSLDSALSAARVLSERHGVLRTRFHVPSIESATQTVSDVGGLDVRCLSGERHPGVLLLKTEVAYGGGGASLDPERDAPMCLLFRRRDRRWGCILVISHLMIDGYGASQLAREYQALVAGVSADSLPPPIDPLAVIHHEARPESMARSTRNIAQMRSLLDRGGAVQLMVGAVGTDGASATASKARSIRFSQDIDYLSWRSGVPKSGVLAGLICVLLWREYGFSPVLLWLLHRVPIHPPRVVYVATNTIATLVAVDLDARSDVRSFLRRTWVSCVNAFRTGRYDPVVRDEMLSEAARSQGLDRVNGLVYLNIHNIPDTLDWGPLAPPVDDEIAEHRAIPGLPVGYRSYFDVKMATRATTITATGQRWPAVGDTAAQCRELIRLAGLMVSSDVTSGDLQTLVAKLSR